MAIALYLDLIQNLPGDINTLFLYITGSSIINQEM